MAVPFAWELGKTCILHGDDGGRENGFVRFAHVAFVWVDLETSEAFRSDRVLLYHTPRIGGTLFIFSQRNGVLVSRGRQNEECAIPSTWSRLFLFVPFIRCHGYPRSIELEAPEQYDASVFVLIFGP